MKTKNLYVGLLGSIYDSTTDEQKLNGKSFRSVKDESTYVIFEIDNSRKNGTDIFSGKKYKVWDLCDYIEIANLIGEKTIRKYEGIEKHMLVPSSDISNEELEMIYSRLNSSSNNINEYPKDLILKCIYETYLLLNNLDIDNNTKKIFINRLMELGKNYIRDISRLIKNNYESNIKITEQSIRIDYLRKIIEIENEIRQIENVNIDDLKADLHSMMKQMTL